MKSKEIDWSQSCWREMLIYQRKSMWREDTLRMIISWIGFEPGQTVVDVGCGLGSVAFGAVDVIVGFFRLFIQ